MTHRGLWTIVYRERVESMSKSTTEVLMGETEWWLAVHWTPWVGPLIEILGREGLRSVSHRAQAVEA